MTTTPSPGQKAQFYLLFPQDKTEFNPELTPITFSLPAGTKFPSDLTQIMKKAQRYFTSESIVLGETLPTCEGCVCSNCPDLVSYCEGKNCIGFTSSVDGIVCDNVSCTKTNDTKYYLLPLYPTDSSLPHYNPKFKFIKVIPPTKIESNAQNLEIVKKLDPKINTFPAEFTNMPFSLVLFSVSYPSLDIFNTEEKYNEIYELCKLSSVLLDLLKEENYAKHNNLLLQQIIKNNKLPQSLLDQEFNKAKKSNELIVEDRRKIREQQLLTKLPDVVDEVLVQRMMEMKKNNMRKPNMQPNMESNMESNMQPPNAPPSVQPNMPPPNAPSGVVKEGYEGEIEIKNLVVPISKQDDTTPDTILVEEKKPWQITSIILIIVLLLCFAYYIYNNFFKSVPTKTLKQKQKSQAR